MRPRHWGALLLALALALGAAGLWWPSPQAPAVLSADPGGTAPDPTLARLAPRASAAAPAPQPAQPKPLADLERQYCSSGRALMERGLQWAASLEASDPHAERQLSAPMTAQRESGERLLRAAMAPLLAQLRQQGSERAGALADHLQQVLEPTAERSQRLLALGQTTRDPVVFLLASKRICRSASDCPRLDRNRWSVIEPDNAMAWMASDLRGDALLQRLVNTRSATTHWDTVRRMLNEAQPASVASPGPLLVEVYLIGIEAAWNIFPTSELRRHCKLARVGSVEAQHCAAALELLWQGSRDDSTNSLLVASLGAGLPAGMSTAPWAERLAWIQRLQALEQDGAQKLVLDPLSGCETPTPELDLLAAVRREGRMAMLQRLMTEQQSAAAAQRP